MTEILKQKTKTEKYREAGLRGAARRKRDANGKYILSEETRQKLRNAGKLGASKRYKKEYI